MHPIRTKLAVLAVGLTCLALGVLFASAVDRSSGTLASAQTSATVPTTERSLRETQNAFIDIAENVTPSVVYVTGQRRVEGRDMEFDLGPFEDFFQFREQPQIQPRPDYRPSGGSGVIVREDGYIVTNNHVVEGMEGLKVTLNDRREFAATVVGRDPSTDLAVLKIEASDLPAADLAAPGDIQVGQWVLALGNPLGLQFTMTAGIVSAIGRGNLGIIQRNDNPYAIEDFIQTDAAINPGNSGGPLVNIDGEVVGLNTAIASRTGGYQGYGFAIPVKIVHEVVGDLIETGEVRRAVLGVSIQPVTPTDRQALELPSGAGVLIADFDPRVAKNPAREAGIRPLDVVLEVEGRTVSTPSELQQAIAFHEPGDEVELTVWREGEERQFDVTLGERPPLSEQEMLAGREPTSREAALGMEVQDLADQGRSALARRTGVDVTAIPAGVVVASVDPLGPAADAGIPEGAIITRIGEQPIGTLADYRQAVESLEPNSAVYFRIYVPFAGATGQQFRALRVPG
ncbi:MAG: trypsin-like peptidase domain-containing protein [Gemmatimonadota bacterium]